MLEPDVLKGTCPVLRGESGGNTADLPAKNPYESMDIKSFYKLYGYACLYLNIHEVSLQDITLTMVGSPKPRNLLSHLQKQRKYRVAETHPGIYSVEGDIFPIQLIESKKLSKGENIWLQNLRNGLSIDGISRILELGNSLNQNKKIKAYMHALVLANIETVEEMKRMSKQSIIAMIRQLEWFDEIKQEEEIRTLLKLINKKLTKLKTREQIIDELELDNFGIEILDHFDEYGYLL